MTKVQNSWFEDAKLKGHIGEKRAIEYLEKLGFKILKWESKRSFDIVAERDAKKFAIEVKYGSSGIDIHKVARLIEQAKKNNCVALIVFVDDEKIYIFKHVGLDDGVSIEDIKRYIDAYPEEIIIRVDGGQTIRWNRIG
jgi:Holliday junction resolvase-like predicted endonuclease